LINDVLNQGERDNPRALRVAAAASAEAGRFAEAIPFAQRALSLSQASGNTALIDELKRNVANYYKGMPWRDPGLP
jgi:hypothetical protein